MTLVLKSWLHRDFSECYFTPSDDVSIKDHPFLSLGNGLLPLLSQQVLKKLQEHLSSSHPSFCFCNYQSCSLVIHLCSVLNAKAFFSYTDSLTLLGPITGWFAPSQASSRSHHPMLLGYTTTVLEPELANYPAHPMMVLNWQCPTLYLYQEIVNSFLK